jgi:hypothetical protein
MKHNKKAGNYYLTSNKDQTLLTSSMNSNNYIIKIFPENFEIYVSADYNIYELTKKEFLFNWFYIKGGNECLVEIENIYDTNLYVWFQQNGINLNKFYSIGGGNDFRISNNGSSGVSINNSSKRNSIDLSNRKQLDLNHNYLINYLNDHFSYTGLLYKLNETTTVSNKQQQCFYSNVNDYSKITSPTTSNNLIHFKIKDFDLSKNSLLLGGIVPG